MNDILLVILLTTVSFLALTLSLAVSKSTNEKIMWMCGGVSLVVGIVSYSYGYSCQSGVSISVVIRTLLTVCRMYTGGCDFGLVSDTPLFANQTVVALFWIGHFMAFYMTASTAIKLLGKHVLRDLRTRMLRKGEVCLVYEPTTDTICLAGKRKKGRPMVLISEHSDETVSALADSLGGVAFAGGWTLRADKKFLKTIGIHGSRRPLDVYCIGDNPTQNLRYAEALLPALQEQGVTPDKLSLFLLGIPEERAARLLAMDGHYGYGTVISCSRYELIARQIIEKQPPWTFIRCDAEGRALNDLRVFVVGFGQMGQTVLRQLIINGQMEGSAFHAEVFDPRMDEERGCFDVCYAEMLKRYDVVLHAASANSDLFYERLTQNPPNIIVLCSGGQKRNMDLGQVLFRWCGIRGIRPCIIQCTPDSLMIDEREYHPEQMNIREMDRAAMALNHSLRGGASPEEEWKACDAFRRANCRAMVNFLPAYLYAAGIRPEEVLAGKWPPPDGVLENLSRTEHLRRCAYYLTMGYMPMDDAAFEYRCGQYRRGEIQDIAHNAAESTHACLVSWEALEERSRRISEACGKAVDYRTEARNIVLAIPEILRQTGA